MGGTGASRRFDAFFIDGRISLFHTQVGELQVHKIGKTRLFQAVSRAVDGTTVNSKDRACRFRRFYDAADAPAYAGQAEHLANAITR